MNLNEYLAEQSLDTPCNANDLIAFGSKGYVVVEHPKSGMHTLVPEVASLPIIFFDWRPKFTLRGARDLWFKWADANQCVNFNANSQAGTIVKYGKDLYAIFRDSIVGVWRFQDILNLKVERSIASTDKTLGEDDLMRLLTIPALNLEVIYVIC